MWRRHVQECRSEQISGENSQRLRRNSHTILHNNCTMCAVDVRGYGVGHTSSSTVSRVKQVTTQKRKLSKVNNNNNTRSRVRRRSSSSSEFSSSATASSVSSQADEVNTETSPQRQNMRNNQPTMAHGLISVIGRRRSMEDAFAVVPNLLHLTWEGRTGKEKEKEVVVEEAFYDFFAVFDGHGGHKVSYKCKERMHHLVAEEATRGEREVNWERVMTNSFERMDAEVAEGEAGRGDDGGTKTVGSTALVVVIGKEEIVVANCGDCRVVLFRDGAPLPLSRDHKPERPDEKQRVEKAGGNVVEDSDCSRVLGVLSTSRSIGDYHLKPYVISEPEVQICKRSASDDFVVIATDGIWDVLDNETVCDLVKKCFSGQVSRKFLEGVAGNCAAAAATMLAELAIARGSKDNISVIVVQLKKFNSKTRSFTK